MISMGVSLDVIFFLTLFSLCVIVAFTVYVPLRKALPYYDPIADWIGHGIPDLGMIYMILVMAGVPAVLPMSWCAAAFATLSGVFVLRLTTRTSYVWWQDILHLLGVLAKAYMFVSVLAWNKVITSYAILFFLVIICLYVRRTYKQIRGITLGRLLFNLEHIVMSVAAILMFAIMQWPAQFPLSGGIICHTPIGAAAPGHSR